MSATVLQVAAELLAVGIAPDALGRVLPDALRRLDEEWLDAVLAGETVPDDLERLAWRSRRAASISPKPIICLAAISEEAIFEAKHDLKHPDRNDDPRLTRAKIAKFTALQEQRRREWDNVQSRADYALDATITYATEAPASPLAARPTTTLDKAVAGTEARGPRHGLICGDRGTQKTRTAISVAGRMAEERRATRQRWIEDYRRDNPRTSYADGADAADAAGLRYLRVGYFAETHQLVGDTVRLAREMHMRAEHHGGVGGPRKLLQRGRIAIEDKGQTTGTGRVLRQGSSGFPSSVINGQREGCPAGLSEAAIAMVEEGLCIHLLVQNPRRGPRSEGSRAR